MQTFLNGDLYVAALLARPVVIVRTWNSIFAEKEFSSLSARVILYLD